MSNSADKQLSNAVDHLFRHEAGKMVAVLSRLFGFSNIEQAEDIVQDTILKALETWKFGSMPANPQAWLYKTAKNKAIDIIRRQKLKYKIDNDLTLLLKSEYTLAPAINELFLEFEIIDSQLRMMFACCHPSISQEAQITLVLKTLCGLSAKEISNAFLTQEETINKRLYRTKEKIRSEHITLDYPGNNEVQKRTEAVLKTLYLLFNEGYNSSHTEQLIREDLCEEAMRLAILLTENEKTNLPETNALLALMCYQVSRFNSRLDDTGFIILLKDQDRALWNRYLIEKGNNYMERSTSGNMIHEFHIEAAIASVHSNAASYEDTDWNMILDLYGKLLHRTGNPIVALNRCLVLAEVEGYDKAILEMESLNDISENYYYKTSLAELYFRSGKKQQAKEIFTQALRYSRSNAEKALIEQKINLC
jgi:RNA polymerase sigma factor (sigma-70 family)